MGGASKVLCLISVMMWLITGLRTAVADNITIPANASTPAIPGYLMRPSGAGPFAAVLVLHWCAGFGQLETDTVNELASAGYVALAIDTLKPQGLRSACKDIDAFRISAQYAAASLAWLATQPYVAPKRLGVVGFSMGGIEVLSLIDPFMGPQPPPPGLRVAVAYYPSCANRDANITVPLLVFNGSADDWIPPAQCQAFVKAASAAGKQAEIVTYPGATHAFNVPSSGTHVYEDHTLTYDPTAAADADSKMKTFLAKYLSP